MAKCDPHVWLIYWFIGSAIFPSVSYKLRNKLIIIYVFSVYIVCILCRHISDVQGDSSKYLIKLNIKKTLKANCDELYYNNKIINLREHIT